MSGGRTSNVKFKVGRVERLTGVILLNVNSCLLTSNINAKKLTGQGKVASPQSGLWTYLDPDKCDT